ncbi:hypothetical protein J2067_004171 [Erwinia rhapontici]|nr:hypothetical protein [Erwinia rhapontici]
MQTIDVGFPYSILFQLDANKACQFTLIIHDKYGLIMRFTSKFRLPVIASFLFSKRF